MSLSGSMRRGAGALALVALASLVCAAVATSLAPENMVMVYLLAVVLAAAKLGLRPAILTAALSVLAFDVLFIPPHFSLRVSDTQYLVTFFALFVVGVVISTLVSRIREKVEQVSLQEARTASLYSLTRDLSVAVDVPAIVEALRRAVHQYLGSGLTVFITMEGSPEVIPSERMIPLDDACRDVVRWVQQSGRRAGPGTAAFQEIDFLFLPIKTGANVMGVMVLEANDAVAHNLQQLEAFASQVGMALERVHLARHAEEARFLREKNHLEQALLNSISHDLRTPLVTISGVLDSMQHDEQRFDEEQRKGMIAIAADEAARLNRFVGSLLDMTRLEAGAMSLRLSPCDVEEIIGCAVGAIEPRMGDHRVVTSVGLGVPPVAVDLALLTQALVNILDNALKYSPPGADITLSARFDGTFVMLEVSDQGPGIPPGQEERIFDKFHRLEFPERTGGTGLGLSIAKGIIQSHQGSISAENRASGGLTVQVRLRPSALDSPPGGEA